MEKIGSSLFFQFFPVIFDEFYRKNLDLIYSINNICRNSINLLIKYID